MEKTGREWFVNDILCALFAGMNRLKKSSVNEMREHILRCRKRVAKCLVNRFNLKVKSIARLVWLLAVFCIYLLLLLLLLLVVDVCSFIFRYTNET